MLVHGSLSWRSAIMVHTFPASLHCSLRTSRTTPTKTNHFNGFMHILAHHRAVKEFHDRFPSNKLASFNLHSRFSASVLLHDDDVNELDKHASFRYIPLPVFESFVSSDLHLVGLEKTTSFFVDSFRSEEHYIANLMRCSTTTTLPRKVQKQDSSEYRVNVGYAIRTLRDELPVVFYKEMNYNIYREDIVFRDPYNAFEGIDCYKSIFLSLRICRQVLFKALWMDVIRLWQPSDYTIMVRWAVHGIPHVPWEVRGRFDGISEYILDRQGKIYEHRVDNVVVNEPPKCTSLTVADLSRLIVCDAELIPTFRQQFFSYLALFSL